MNLPEARLQALYGASAVPGLHEFRRLHVAARVAAQNVPQGAFVECGVLNGSSAAAIALADPKREIWLYDTFEGLPAATEIDGAEARTLTGRCRGRAAVRDQAEP